MKRVLYIFVISLLACSSVRAQPHPIMLPQKWVTASVPELCFRDSLFLKGLDALVFAEIHSSRPLIDDEYMDCFNVRCKTIDKQDGTYDISISHTSEAFIYWNDDFKGVFRYRGKLFLWFDEIPDTLLYVSDEEAELKYWTGGLRWFDGSIADFYLYYDGDRLALTSIKWHVPTDFVSFGR